MVRVLAFLATAAALVIVGCGESSKSKSVSSNPTASQCEPSAEAGRVSRAAYMSKYMIAVTIGPQEAMYTQAQVNKKHPKQGELMMGGAAMTGGGMGGSAMHGGNAAMHHLEVAICDRTSGKRLTSASPKIAVTASGANTQRVPVAMMQGVADVGAMNDVHYGNNVALSSGKLATVTVTVGGEKATVRLPVNVGGSATSDGHTGGGSGM